jgi:hypothetical protein
MYHGVAADCTVLLGPVSIRCEGGQPHLKRDVLVLGNSRRVQGMHSHCVLKAEQDASSEERRRISEEAYLDATLQMAPAAGSKALRGDAKYQHMLHMQEDFCVQVELFVAVALHALLRHRGIEWRLLKKVQPAADGAQQFEVRLTRDCGLTQLVGGI